MARGKTTGDLTTLQMALVGYEIEKKKIDEKIKEIKAQLGRRGANLGVAAIAAEAPAPRKRNLSADARRRIAMAQKRRWAEHRRKAAAAKSAKGDGKPQA